MIRPCNHFFWGSSCSHGGLAFPWEGTLLDRSSNCPSSWRNVWDHSTMERPHKRRYLFGPVFLQFQQIREQPQAAWKMCPFRWASSRQSGAAPRLVQRAYLIRVSESQTGWYDIPEMVAISALENGTGVMVFRKEFWWDNKKADWIQTNKSSCSLCDYLKFWRRDLWL